VLLSINARLAKVLNVRETQIASTVALLDDGATVPFIARYRKEVTGGLDDTQLRNLVEKLNYMRELDDRRETILNSIREQGKLTPELEELILATDNKTTLEDLYLPYKPKRRTKAQIAREAGLEPLAMSFLENQTLVPEIEAAKYISDIVPDTKAALDGARYILIELFAENANVLSKIRARLNNEAMISAKVVSGREADGIKFTDYYDFSQSVKTIPSHRALAILRGMNEGVLTIKVNYADEGDKLASQNYENIIIEEFNITTTNNASIWLLECVRLAFKAKIFVTLETELIANMRENAGVEAINVFATNLNNLLLQAPAGSSTTIGLDPGIRTGVKVAVVDNTGKLLDYTTVYPFQPQNKYQAAIESIALLIKKYQVTLVSIGNGTASRETEKMVADVEAKYPELKFTKVMVSEAGASVYSASEYASKEFPDLDVSIRGAVSIARRLQDPLAELVKIDPKSIGVGQYQHDVNQNKLSEALTNVVEDCVNKVGVDVNTASVPLLTHVAGLNSIIATNVVSYRDSNGKFTNRKDLKKVPRLGDKTFEQCAGFLRINDGENILDRSAVHPESYHLVEEISKRLNCKVEQLIGNSSLLNTIKASEFVTDTHGLPTINDVLKELDKPGRDPRGEFKTAKFSDGIESINDLVPGMELEGVVTNVTNFGAFIDIGVHQDGLVHISQIADKFVANPSDVLKTGQIVKVRVVEVDAKRKRIGLTMRSNVIKTNNNSEDKQAVYNKVKSKPQQPLGSMADAFAKLKR
jgi:uncharacterized protein